MANISGTDLKFPCRIAVRNGFYKETEPDHIADKITINNT